MNRFFLHLFFLLASNFSLIAQSGRSYEQDYILDRKKPLGIIKTYEPLYQTNPSRKIALELANAFLKVRKFEKAVMYYEIVLNAEGLSDKETANYFSALYELGDRDAAKTIAGEYKNRYGKSEPLIKIDSLAKLMAKEPFYYEYNLSANSIDDEMGLIKVHDSLSFINTNRYLSELATNQNLRGEFSPYLMAYKGIDSPIVQFTGLVDKNDFHGDYVSHFDETESIAYITRKTVDADMNYRLSIYTAKLDKDNILEKWIAFPYNSSAYSVGYPTVAKDGEMLYFVSDMPGGYGGTDIYRCLKLENGTWGAPINLGKEVNTEGDELYPYISPQGNTLYFSSTGHSIFGGLDINKSEKTRFHSFKKPENLGLPFNSDKDDFGVLFNDNYGTEGFFNSSRDEGKGGVDIYYFSYQNNKVCRDPVKNFKMLVIDKKTRTPIQYVNLKMTVKADGRVFEDITDENGEVNLTVEGCNDFNVEATRDLYLNNEFYYDGFRKFVTIELDRKELNNIVELESILYELGKYEVPARSIPQMEKLAILLKKNPDIKIELSSHTDSRGDDEFNMKLSQKRAEGIVNFLVNSGIKSSQLTAKGYGESQLTNECGNGADCTEEMHEKNRRSEFKIVEITK